ncbi:MAG: hypothetical protein AAGI30_11170, partial [Planctomycetota bacterium]
MRRARVVARVAVMLMLAASAVMAEHHPVDQEHTSHDDQIGATCLDFGDACKIGFGTLGHDRNLERGRESSRDRSSDGLSPPGGSEFRDIVFSEGESFPRIEGDVIFRIGFNNVYEAEQPRAETLDEFVEMIASPEFRLTEDLSIRSEFRLETTAPPEEDRRFQDEGLFVRSLYARYALTDRFAVHAGKFTPSYAIASLVTPGMYGNNYNKEIELIERVGFGAEYTFGSAASGRHTLSASTFFEDTSILSESLGSNRGRTTLDDGGASNTESFESFTVSLEGTDLPHAPGFTYKLGFVYEAAGRGDEADEYGIAIAAMQSWQLGDESSFVVIGEVAPLWNFQGTADTIIYSSAGVALQAGRWTGVVSGT